MVLMHTPTYDPNFTLPHLVLKNPAGVTYPLQDQMGKKGMVVAFIANHCPYVQSIANKLASEAVALSRMKVGFVAIASSDTSRYPSDGPEGMYALAKEKKFPFPYLFDANQEVAHAFDAVCTPDFFGFNAQGQLCYRGRLDDSGMEYTQDRPRDLIKAMRYIATHGTAPSKQHPSQGCSIKWKTVK